MEKDLRIWKKENNKAASEVPGIVKKGMAVDLAETLILVRAFNSTQGTSQAQARYSHKRDATPCMSDVYIQCSNVSFSIYYSDLGQVFCLFTEPQISSTMIEK